MKNKGLFILLITAVILLAIGMLFKIVHWPYAIVPLILGLAIGAIALIKLIFRSLTAPTIKNQDL